MNHAMSLAAVQTLYRCSPEDEPDGGIAGKRRDLQDPSLADDLPFKVELWSEDKSRIDLLVAVTASGSIGFAAYHAATREYPDRYITLRNRDTIVARWNGPTH